MRTVAVLQAQSTRHEASDVVFAAARTETLRETARGERFETGDITTDSQTRFETTHTHEPV